ncbi:MAG: DUF1189 family protein [Candidatus Omnitrophota bacterium]|nr:MAG: DUF1189 family protein [Candidatus Omnitrophota bacterium]
MLAVLESFNPKFYKEIAKKKFSRSLGFLVVFIVIISAIISFKYSAAIKKVLPQIISWAQNNLGSISEDLPEIEIRDGILTLPQTFYSKEWGQDFSFVIEPQREKVFPMLEGYSNVLILTDTKLIMKYSKPDTGQSEIKMYELAEIKHLNLVPIQDGVKVSIQEDSFNITPLFVEKLISRFSWFIYPVIFFWLMFMYSLNKVIQLFFFSLLSLIFKNSLNRQLSYKQLLTIGIYAMVPPTVLAVIMELLGINFTAFWIVYLGIYVFYLFSGIKAAGQTPQKETPHVEIP